MPDEKRLTILLTNDDGYQAEGINVLADYLEEIADVRIVAPKGDCSMIGDTISDEVYAERLSWDDRDIQVLEGTRRYPTFISPPRTLYYSHGSYGQTRYIPAEEHLTPYQCSGTPRDCVNYALSELYRGEIDIVISGINQGYNLGCDFQLSGTMAAACEAALREKIGIAISAAASEEGDYNFELAAEFCRELVLWISHSLLDPERKALLTNNIYFNLNVPALPTEDVKGLALTFLGSDYIPERTMGMVPYKPKYEILDLEDPHLFKKLHEEWLRRKGYGPQCEPMLISDEDECPEWWKWPYIVWKKRPLSGEYGSDQWAIEEGKHLSLTVLHSYVHPDIVPSVSPLHIEPLPIIRGLSFLDELLKSEAETKEAKKKAKKNVESLLLEEFSLGPHKLERFVED